MRVRGRCADLLRTEHVYTRDCHFFLAETLAKLGRYRDARAALAPLVAAEPHNAQGHALADRMDRQLAQGRSPRPSRADAPVTRAGWALLCPVCLCVCVCVCVRLCMYAPHSLTLSLALCVCGVGEVEGVLGLGLVMGGSLVVGGAVVLAALLARGRRS
jgi:hypothetical protein